MPEKQYLKVIAEYRTNSTIRPLSFWWEDEHVTIDQVMNVLPMASTKGGGNAWRYNCKAQAKTFMLYNNKYCNVLQSI
jgi:hypothetical protein